MTEQSDAKEAQLAILSDPPIALRPPTGEVETAQCHVLAPIGASGASSRPKSEFINSSSSWTKQAATFKQPPPGILHLQNGKTPNEVLGGFDCRDARRPESIGSDVQQNVEDAYAAFAKDEHWALAETGKLEEFPERLDSFKIIATKFSDHRASLWKQAKLRLMKEMPQTQVHREFNRIIWYQTVNAVESGQYYDTYGEEVDLSVKIGTLLPSVSYTGKDFSSRSKSAHAAGPGITVLCKSRIGVEVFNGSMLVLLRIVPEFKKCSPLLLNITAEGHAGGTCREGGEGVEEQLFMVSNYFQTYGEAGNLRWDVDTAVYTPRVIVFRGSDEPSKGDDTWVESGYPLLPYGQVRSAACIAVAGIRQPNLDSTAHLTLADKEVYRKKIRLVLRVAAHQGHNFLILGAIGCGEFENAARDIAEIFHEVIMETEFQDEKCCIQKIWFAMGANAPDGVVDPFRELFATEHFSPTVTETIAISQALVPSQSSALEKQPTHANAALAVRHGPDELGIIFRDRAGPEIVMKVKRYDALRLAIHAACSGLCIDESSCHFSFHGKPVRAIDSPEGLHLGEGSVLFLEHGRASTPSEATLKTPEATLVLDLESRCAACYSVQFASSAVLEKNPEMLCARCGVRSFPQVWKRPDDVILKQQKDLIGSASAVQKKGGNNKITTSGEVIEQDYEGQHVEAPVGGMLALVTQVQRERLCLGAVCYFFFCLTFVVMATLQRPVQETFEVHSALRRELVSEVIPGTLGTTFQDISSWGEFWSWTDGVLMQKVYRADNNVNVTNLTFTVGRYNRVLSAIRFRQVRVKPSLASCSHNEKGLLPTMFEMACSRNDPADATYSCDTPLESHTLSRPCWGKWNEAFQDDTYPGRFELASAKAANSWNPSWNLMCLENCDAYFINGYRTSTDYVAFGLPSVALWTAGFDVYGSSEQGRLECRNACDGSETAWMTGLSGQSGKGNFPDYGTAADVVLLPLVRTTAEERITAMQRERWTSESTRGLAVEINTYNPNYDLATAIRIMIDANPGGLLEPHVEMMSCRLTMFRGTLDSFRLVLEIVFSVWLLYYFAIEMIEFYKSRWNYFFDIWNYVELANLSAYVITMVLWFKTISSHNFDDFKKRDLLDFKDLYPVAKDFNLGFTLASFNLIYGFVRFFKYFRLSMTFRMFWDTLASALQVILPLLVVFVGCIFAFMFSGHWLFGHRVRRFSSISDALSYLVVSIKDGIDYEELKIAAPGGAPLWYFAWYFVSKILFVSLLIAITTVLFGESLRQSQAQEACRQKALEQGAKIPTLANSVMHDFAPCLLGNASKEDIEAHEHHRELKEAMEEVDLEDLWARVMQGVLDEEVALDAAELKFLFGQGATAEQNARHFINRVCNLASLEHVEPHKYRSALDKIDELQRQVDAMESHIQVSRDALAQRFPKLRTFLSRPPQQHPAGVLEGGRKIRYVLKEGMLIGGVYHLVEMKTDEVDLMICAFDGAAGKTLHLSVADEEANGDYVSLAKRLRLGIEFGAGGEQARLELGPPVDPAQCTASSGFAVLHSDIASSNIVMPATVEGAAAKGSTPARPPRPKGALAVASAILQAKRKGMAATVAFEEGNSVKQFVQAKPLKREE